MAKESENKQRSIIKSSSQFGATTLLSRISGFVRDILFANYFGASANTVGVVFTATGATTGTGTVSGQQGNEKGELWLDTTSGYVLKIYDQVPSLYLHL